jgi:hypothetical protein
VRLSTYDSRPIPSPSKRAPLSGGPRAAGEDPTTTAIGQD